MLNKYGVLQKGIYNFVSSDQFIQTYRAGFSVILYQNRSGFFCFVVKCNVILIGHFADNTFEVNFLTNTQHHGVTS